MVHCVVTVNRIYFARYYCSRMANQNFRERVFFANGQKAVKTKICQNLKFRVSVNRPSSPARVVLIQFNRPNNNTVSAAMCTHMRDLYPWGGWIWCDGVSITGSTNVTDRYCSKDSLQVESTKTMLQRPDTPRYQKGVRFWGRGY